MKSKIFFTVIFVCLCFSIKAQWQKIIDGSFLSITANDSLIAADNLGQLIFLNHNDSVRVATETCSHCCMGYTGIVISGAKILTANCDSYIFLTTDYGLHWDSVCNGLPQYTFVYSLVAFDTGYFAATSYGLYYSSGNCTYWSRITNGLPSSHFTSVAVKGSKIFAGTENKGIYVSSDSGYTWASANIGLPDSAYVMKLLIGESFILARLYYGKGIYYSTNAGANWSVIQNNQTSSKLKALVVNGSNIFAGFEDTGVLMSPDTGKTWKSFNEGFTDSSVYGLAVSGQYLYAAAWSGLWKRKLSEMSGMAENKNNPPFMFYPNPATSQITMQNQDSKNKESQIIIKNIIGEEVLLTKSTSTKTIDISTLQKGIYILQFLENNQIIATQKLIKQ